MTTKHMFYIVLLLFSGTQMARAQQTADSGVYSLNQLIDSAFANNHLLLAKQYQVEEKTLKSEDLKVKKYPMVMVNSTGLYNANVSEFSIPAGALGVIPGSPSPILLPNQDIRLEPMEHFLFSAGVMVYQPITQQWKIGTGEKVAILDAQTTSTELDKNRLQVKDAVEQLYFGLLINKHQQAESEAKIRWIQSRMQDVETALSAGKTIDVSKMGLMASIADERQNLLKLQIQEEDYLSELQRICVLPSGEFNIEEPLQLQELVVIRTTTETDSALVNNPDVLLAEQLTQKASLGLQANRQSLLPDVGIVGGYMYQKGTTLIPENNPFIGINLKWNLQDAILTAKEAEQLKRASLQAGENYLNVQQQIKTDVEKTVRKLKQLEALMEVAEQNLTYRTADLELQKSKKEAGTATETDVLSAEVAWYKAKGDVYSSVYAYRLTLTDLSNLTGNFR